MEMTELERSMAKRLPGYGELAAKAADIVRGCVTDPRIWLDTGCGNGIVVKENLNAFPKTQFVLADPYPENIDGAKERMCGEQRCLYIERPTAELNFGESLDVITAMFCHHYQRTLEERKRTLSNCFRMMKRGAVLITVEHARYPDQEDKDREWKGFMRSNGLPEPFIEQMVSRRDTEYFPLTEEEHFRMMEETGFSDIQVFWRTCSDIGLTARKP